MPDNTNNDSNRINNDSGRIYGSESSSVLSPGGIDPNIFSDRTNSSNRYGASNGKGIVRTVFEESSEKKVESERNNLTVELHPNDPNKGRNNDIREEKELINEEKKRKPQPQVGQYEPEPDDELDAIPKSEITNKPNTSTSTSTIRSFVKLISNLFRGGGKISNYNESDYLNSSVKFKDSNHHGTSKVAPAPSPTIEPLSSSSSSSEQDDKKLR